MACTTSPAQFGSSASFSPYGALPPQGPHNQPPPSPPTYAHSQTYGQQYGYGQHYGYGQQYGGQQYGQYPDQSYGAPPSPSTPTMGSTSGYGQGQYQSPYHQQQQQQQQQHQQQYSQPPTPSNMLPAGLPPMPLSPGQFSSTSNGLRSQPISPRNSSNFCPQQPISPGNSSTFCPQQPISPGNSSNFLPQQSPLFSGSGWLGSGLSSSALEVERRAALDSVTRLFLEPSKWGLPDSSSLIPPFGLNLTTSQLHPESLMKHTNNTSSNNNNNSNNSNNNDHSSTRGSAAGDPASAFSLPWPATPTKRVDWPSTPASTAPTNATDHFGTDWSQIAPKRSTTTTPLDGFESTFWEAATKAFPRSPKRRGEKKDGKENHHQKAPDVDQTSILLPQPSQFATGGNPFARTTTTGQTPDETSKNKAPEGSPSKGKMWFEDEKRPPKEDLNKQLTDLQEQLKVMEERSRKKEEICRLQEYRDELSERLGSNHSDRSRERSTGPAPTMTRSKSNPPVDLSWARSSSSTAPPPQVPTPPEEVLTKAAKPAIENIFDWVESPSETERYRQLFGSFAIPRFASLPASAAKDLLEKTNLPRKELAQIWRLADHDSDGRLTLGEFVVALTLATLRVRGLQLPPILPPALAELRDRLDRERSESEAKAAAPASWASGSVGELSPGQSPATPAPVDPSAGWTNTADVQLHSEGSEGPRSGPQTGGWSTFGTGSGPVESSGASWNASQATSAWPVGWGDASQPTFSNTGEEAFGSSGNFPAAEQEGKKTHKQQRHKHHHRNDHEDHDEEDDAENKTKKWKGPTDEDVQDYVAMFDRLVAGTPELPETQGGDVNLGKLALKFESTEEAFLNAALSKDQLQQVWALADVDNDGRLTKGEFVCAQHLASELRYGVPLPTSRPKRLGKLVAKIDGDIGVVGVVGVGVREHEQHKHGHDHEHAEEGEAPNTKAAARSGDEGEEGAAASAAATARAEAAATTSTATTAKAAEGSFAKPLEGGNPPAASNSFGAWPTFPSGEAAVRPAEHNETVAGKPEEATATATATATAEEQHEAKDDEEEDDDEEVSEDDETHWKLDRKETQVYCNMFFHTDHAGDGSLGANDARKLLETTQLPKSVLGDIWELSDVDMDGRLTMSEFVCAMQLASNCKRGVPLPKELPQDLIDLCTEIEENGGPTSRF